MTSRSSAAVVVLSLVCASRIALGADAVAGAKSASQWRGEHEQQIVSELADFAAIPNLASDLPNIERNATRLRELCEARGLIVRLLRLEGVPPIVVADLRVSGAQRTIGFYAHYDGQPVDRARWQSDPWQPAMRDGAGRDVDWRKAKALDPEWRLYARAVSDDKAPIIAMLAALDALRAAKLTPAVNLRFVFEGEEEAGSPHLAAYLEKYADVLRPDAWILCDGPVHQSRKPALFFGARGTVDLELTTYGPIKGLHDGHYGNWVGNPIVSLAHLISSLRDEQGRISIDGFYDNVRPPSQAERDALGAIPNIESELRQTFQIAATEGDGKPLNELLMLPALNFRGIQAGHVGAEAANVIPTEARASIDFRLVPDQTPESVKALVERHFEKLGYTIVRDAPDEAMRRSKPKLLRVNWGAGYPPGRTPLDLPLSREAAAIMTAAGHEPVRLPTLGGSIPMYLFQQPGNTPTIGLPIVNHDNNQHAADENLRLQNLWDGIEIYAALFSALAPK
jgi:acetylornithine deacetylase/succinyl-diaminopimelate desuccinylase-like protein